MIAWIGPIGNRIQRLDPLHSSLVISTVLPDLVAKNTPIPLLTGEDNLVLLHTLPHNYIFKFRLCCTYIYQGLFRSDPATTSFIEVTIPHPSLAIEINIREAYNVNICMIT